MTDLEKAQLKDKILKFLISLPNNITYDVDRIHEELNTTEYYASMCIKEIIMENEFLEFQQEQYGDQIQLVRIKPEYREMLKNGYFVQQLKKDKKSKQKSRTWEVFKVLVSPAIGIITIVVNIWLTSSKGQEVKELRNRVEILEETMNKKVDNIKNENVKESIISSDTNTISMDSVQIE